MLFVCCLHSPSPCLFPVSLCHLSCFSFISLRLQCARMINERKFHFIFSARYFCFPSPSPPAVRCFLFLCFGLAFCSACLAPVVVVVSRILAAIAAAFFAPPCSLLILLLCAAPLPLLSLLFLLLPLSSSDRGQIMRARLASQSGCLFPAIAISIIY